MEKVEELPFYEQIKYNNNEVHKSQQSTEEKEENRTNVNNSNDSSVKRVYSINTIKKDKRKFKKNNDKISQKKLCSLNKFETFELGNLINQNKKNSPNQLSISQNETLEKLLFEKNDSKAPKPRGPKPKNPQKKRKHSPSFYDNLMDKAGRMFIKSYRDLLNYRCQKYGLILHRINFKGVYGFGYKSHRRFLKRKLKNIFRFRNKQNKKSISDMIRNKKDLIFTTIINYSVKKAYDLYAKNYHYLAIGGAEFHVSNFRTINESLKEKGKDIKNKSYSELLEEVSKNYVNNIYKEKKKSRTQRIRFRYKIKFIRY